MGEEIKPGAREVSWVPVARLGLTLPSPARHGGCKKTATAVPLALSLDRERDQKAESELRKAPSGGVVSCHPREGSGSGILREARGE